MKPTPRVLSGIQPTGKLHLGNYLGALKNWVAMQDEFPGECYYCIVDLHAITAPYKPAQFKQRVFDTALDFLAAGLDPERSAIFIQSQVTGHVRLQWILSTLTPLGLLERMTQFKDKKQRQSENINAGLLTYPVLMAADILVYKATLVPVGDDQLQHIELTREVARKFNHTFGATFPEPEARLTAGARIMSLSDPASKMSKSDSERSFITLDEEPAGIARRLKKAVTDAGTSGDVGPGGKNLLTILGVVDPEGHAEFKRHAEAGTIRYSDLKSHLAEKLAEYLAPFRDRRAALASQPKEVWDVLEAGREQAEKITSQTLTDVTERMGFVR
ncbi:MAG: tryptophan--tRNA ligase [Candidatus Krumholzibacteriia bacterium]